MSFSNIILNRTTIKNIIVKDRSGNTLCSNVMLVKVGDTTVFRKDTSLFISYNVGYTTKEEDYTECGVTYYKYYPAAPKIRVSMLNQARPIRSISFKGYIDLYDYYSDIRIVNCPDNSKGSLSANGTISLDGTRTYTDSYSDIPYVYTKGNLVATITFTDGGVINVSMPNLSKFKLSASEYLYKNTF